MCNQCVIIEDSLLKVNRAIVICFKEKQLLLFLFKTHENGTVHFQQVIFNDNTYYISNDYTSMITHQHLIFHYYDLPHPNHQGECSIPGILQLLEVAP